MNRRIKMIGIIALVLLLAVGFAAVTTNLLINNTANISNNQDDFDVLFTKAKSESGGYASIGTDGKTITYSTKKLSMIGDTATLEYTVKNYSSQYDANVIVSYTAVNELSGVDYSDYYSISMNGFDSSSPTLVTGRNTVDGTITIELLRAITENVSITFTVTMNSNAIERENEAVYSPQYEIVSGDLDTIGSIVKIADEEFYVIGQEDSSHVKLLSKWNLKVGNIYNSSITKTGEYTSSDTGYGLQSSDAKGYVAGASTYNGTVAFSSTNYWSSTVSTYPAWVYTNEKTNGTYKASIAEHVDNYVTYLTQQGVSVTGRLIKQEELVTLGCNASTNYCDSNGSHGGTAPAWVYQTSYWSGSAFGSSFVWGVDSNGSFIDFNYYGSAGNFGVRPVIILDI